MASKPKQGPSKKPASAPNYKPKPNNPGQSQQNKNTKPDGTNHGNKQQKSPHPQNTQNKKPDGTNHGNKQQKSPHPQNTQNKKPDGTNHGNKQQKSPHPQNTQNKNPHNQNTQNKQPNLQPKIIHHKNPQQKRPINLVYVDHRRLYAHPIYPNPPVQLNVLMHMNAPIQQNPPMQMSVPIQPSLPIQMNAPIRPNPPMNLNSTKQPNTENPGPSFSATQKMLNEVLDLLECPVCLEFIQAPIFMCETGHNICGPCRTKLFLPVCPICKTTITGQRNFDLEKIASKMATPCTNSSYGCNYVGSPDDAKLHFKNCLFRQMFCPMGREFNMCTWNGSISKLQIHFAEEHQNNTRLKPGCPVSFDNFDITIKDEDMQLINVGKFSYLYHVKIDPSKMFAYWGVQFIGPHQDAAKTKYEFNIFNNKKTKKVLTYSDECQPDNLSFQAIYDSGNCVTVPLHVLKNFIHDNRRFTFKFFIKPGENPYLVEIPRPTQPPAQANSQPNEFDTSEMLALSRKMDLL